ncbi:MAG: hypothetical protein PVJ64_09920 [Gemmatimonadales bacterium]|jgi:hypothetical protein
MTVNGLRAVAAGKWGDAGLSLAFGLLFGGVGFGLLAALFRGRKRQQELERLQGEHPAEPWLWRADWAAGRIEGYLREGEALALLVLVLPLVGAGLLVWAIRATIRHRKFGVSVFRMASAPGVSIVFGLFAVLLFFAVFQAWLGSTRVVLTPGEARVSHSPLGRTRKLTADEIEDLTLKIGMQAGNRPYYDIQIVKCDGKRVYVGRSIKDKQEAEWLVEQLREVLSL